MNWGLRKAVVWSIVTIGLATAIGVMGQGRGGRGGGAAAPAPAPAPAQAAPAGDQSGLPEGDGKKVVLDNCAGCHGLEQITSAKKDVAGWSETLSHMVTYGASITDAQIPTLAAYLAKSFGPQGAAPATDPAKPGDKPADKPGDKKEDPDVVGERILNTACTTCHDLGPITRKNDDRNAWESTVYGMVGNGADVKDAEIPILVDYLFKNYGPPKAATPPAPGAPAAPVTPAAPAGRGARGQ